MFRRAMCLILLLPLAANAGDDWRKQATDPEKVRNLVEVMPGASELMLQMGQRYQNLYWAAKQGKWEFAEYQVEEMEDLLKKLQITRPGRAATAQEFQDSAWPRLTKAIEARAWKTFEPAFEHMRQQCMVCHVKNDHGFIKLPVPKRAGSPVLNMD